MFVFAPAPSRMRSLECQLMSSTKRRTGFPVKDILRLIIHLLYNLTVYSKELVLLSPASTSAESINESGAILVSTVGAPTMVTVSEYNTAITKIHFCVRDFFRERRALVISEVRSQNHLHSAVLFGGSRN